MQGAYTNHVGERENRYVQDVDHCIAKALVTNNPKGTLFALEDLTGIRAVTERVKGPIVTKPSPGRSMTSR